MSISRYWQTVYMVDNYSHYPDEQGVNYFGGWKAAWYFAVKQFDGFPENNPKIYLLIDCSREQDWSVYTARLEMEVTAKDVPSQILAQSQGNRRRRS